MNAKELERYAEQERAKITEFFSTYVGELPKVKNGAENIVNPKLMVATALERIKNSHKSTDFMACIRRLKWYRQYLEKL
jgi:hypothetical protein